MYYVLGMSKPLYSLVGNAFKKFDNQVGNM